MATIVWIILLIVTFVWTLSSRLIYNLAIAPFEPALRQWLFFKAPVRLLNRIVLSAVKGAVNGRTHADAMFELVTIRIFVVFLPMLLMFGLAAGLADMSIENLNAKLGIVVEEAPALTPEQELERITFKSRFYRTLIGIGIVLMFGSFALSSFASMRSRMSFTHQRTMSKLQPFLTPEELHELMIVEHGVHTDAATYRYISAVQRMTDAHGLSDIAHIWPRRLVPNQTVADQG